MLLKVVYNTSIDCVKNDYINVKNYAYFTIINIHRLFWLAQCKSIVSGIDIVYLLIYKLYNHANGINETYIQKRKLKIYTNNTAGQHIT